MYQESDSESPDFLEKTAISRGKSGPLHNAVCIEFIYTGSCSYDSYLILRFGFHDISNVE
jgi:hypothetical protein